MKDWKTLITGGIIGFIGGVVVMKIFHRLEPPKVVEIPIPERNIPVQKPRMRDARRSPMIYGRRKIM